VLLRTFQRLTRVAQLEAEGMLVGDWDRVPAAHRDAYRAMAAAMSRAGVDTGDLAPIWAWRGPVRLLDAAPLLDPEHELSTGYATVEFAAPPELVVASDYGAWNDFLEALFLGEPASWEPAASNRSVPGPEQVCLPFLRAEWVRGVRSLPTTGWDELDGSLPA
jgi:hypothetical protein